MKSSMDNLYTIFEQHLLNALVEEESTDEFLKRVVNDYLASLGDSVVILREHRSGIEEDLREEVLEMLRKRTYGHYSLKEFRKAARDKTDSAPTKTASKALAAANMIRARARKSRRAN
ncbi:MAG: hypothetical protein NDI61_02550 [Bdellovibrionaceae bacterium]|nr:hypothetical protein [Pseudobdellovibrionaceae bacterium]